MRRRLPGLRVLACTACVVLLGACATLGTGRGKDPNVMVGLVLDPEGRAISFAKVSVVAQTAAESARPLRGDDVDPLGARGLAVTTEGGKWMVDHVSDDEGVDAGMPAGWYYELTVYKPGFHVWKDSVLYEKGTLKVDVTLYPDTISIEDLGNVVDTSVGDTNTGTGVLRSGQ
jgi:hypothetical protein